MVQILTWIIIAYGLTNISMFGSILDKPRTYLRSKSEFINELLDCVMCTSFWTGVFLFVFYYPLIVVPYHIFYIEIIINCFLTACFTSGAVWALNAIIEYFESFKKT